MILIRIMFYNVVEVLFGLLVYNISVKSLKKSIIRKWREAFTLLLFASIFAVTHGLITIVGIVPDFSNKVMFPLLSSVMVLSIFMLSRMKGLNA